MWKAFDQVILFIGIYFGEMIRDLYACIYTHVYTQVSVILYIRFIAVEFSFQYYSVQFSRSVVSDSLWSQGTQYAKPPCPSPTPRVYSNSCPSSQWCHPAISSSVVPFSSCLQCFPASVFSSESVLRIRRPSIGASASASVLPMNIQDWSLGWTGWISLQSKGLSRVFFNTTVQKHQFFGTQLSLWSNSHIHTWLQKNHSFD